MDPHRAPLLPHRDSVSVAGHPAWTFLKLQKFLSFSLFFMKQTFQKSPCCMSFLSSFSLMEHHPCLEASMLVSSKNLENHILHRFPRPPTLKEFASSQNQPPPNEPPQKKTRPYQGLINNWFPLIKPY